MLDYQTHICALLSMLNGKVNKTEIKAIEYLLGKQEKQIIQLLNAKLEKTPGPFQDLLCGPSKFLSIEEYDLDADGATIRFVVISVEIPGGTYTEWIPWFLVEDD